MNYGLDSQAGKEGRESACTGAQHARQENLMVTPGATIAARACKMLFNKLSI